MKDYEHVVVWLDYFNKIGKESCVNDPSFKELSDAAIAAGFEITESNEPTALSQVYNFFLLQVVSNIIPLVSIIFG